MTDREDPFEAYRAKKDVERKKASARPSPPPGPGTTPGRPRGFETHRANFGKEGAPAPEPAPPPKGYTTDRAAKQGKVEIPPRPKGYDTGKIGPGIPPAPEKA